MHTKTFGWVNRCPWTGRVVINNSGLIGKVKNRKLRFGTCLRPVPNLLGADDVAVTRVHQT